MRILLTLWLLLPLTLAILAVGCGAPSKGTVVDKRYEEPRTDTYWTDECIVYGSNGTCTYHQMVQHERYDDEDWKLLLQDGNNKGWREVSHAEYLATKIGDCFGCSSGSGG